MQLDAFYIVFIFIHSGSGEHSIIILSFCCASESNIIANDMPCLASKLKTKLPFVMRAIGVIK